MFDRFTDRARRAVVLAQEEARSFNHDYIGTEHLLLGLLHDPESVAGAVLGSTGVTLAAVRERMNQVVSRRRGRRQNFLPFSTHAKQALESSSQQATQSQHPAVGPEHLLMAVLSQSDGVAVALLESMGADLHAVRSHIVELSSQQPPAPGADRAAPGAVVSARAPAGGTASRADDPPSGKQPVWMAPPADELPGVVPVGRILARSDRGVVVALSHVEVFREGCRFCLRVAARRPAGMSDGEWAQLHDTVIAPPQAAPPASSSGTAARSNQRLQFALRLVDGRLVSTTDAWQSLETARATRREPTGPVLMPRGGGGGGHDPVMLSWELWLWPLPPATRIDLEVQWPAFQIETTSIELDGAALVDTANLSRPLWPEATF